MTWNEEINALGYTRASIDHPFSEVFALNVPELKRWADAGLRFALTWDELSPLLGIPILPQTAEAYRLLAATLRAYGMTEPEMRVLMSGSAERLVNLN